MYWAASKHSGDYELRAMRLARGKHPAPPSFRLRHHKGGAECKDPVYTCDLLLSLHIHRVPGFYLSKGVEPMYTCLVFGLLTFLTRTQELGTRLSVHVTLFLSCYAIQWVTIERLPRLPFNTVLDDITSSVVITLLVIAVTQSVCYELGAWEDETNGSDFDWRHARKCDRISAGVIIAFFLVYCVGFKFAYKVWLWTCSEGHGASRSWASGGQYRNKKCRAIEAWELEITDEFLARNKSYLGTGTEIKLDEGEEF